jgi:hypothetical protein
MSTAEPDHRRYQFSLRSLLLFTAFVAVLCAIGVRTDWSVCAVIAVGGVAGGIVARTWSGLVLGSVLGSMCAVVGVVAFAFVWCIVFRMPIRWVPFWEFIAAVKIVAIIGSLAGGVLGGSTARFRSER